MCEEELIDNENDKIIFLDAIQNLLPSLRSSGMSDLLNMSKFYLNENGRKTFVDQFVSEKKTESKQDRRNSGFFDRLKDGLGFKKSKSSQTENLNSDDNSSNNPITDLCVIQSSDEIPEGFQKVSKNHGSKKYNLNYSSGGNQIFLCFKRDASKKSVPITNLSVIFPDQSEHVPPGYFVLCRGTKACNLNSGTSAERVYICYKKDPGGNPITDIVPIYKNGEPPESYHLIEKSVSGLNANLNSGTGGTDIYLAYKQDLVKVSHLLNETKSSKYETFPQKRHTIGSDRRDLSELRDKKNNSPLNMKIENRRKSLTFDYPDSEDTFLEDKFSSSMKSLNQFIKEENSSQRSISPSLNNQDVKSSDISDAGIDSSHISNSDVDDNESKSSNRDRLDSINFEALEIDTEGENLMTSRYDFVSDSDGFIPPRIYRNGLYLVLSALYIRHGDSHEKALEGLSRIFNETSILLNDLNSTPSADSYRMVDIVIDSVCNSFDLISESSYLPYFQFLDAVIIKSKEGISHLSLQKIFKTLSYLFNQYSSYDEWSYSGNHLPFDEFSENSPYRILTSLLQKTNSLIEQQEEISQFLPEFDQDDFYEDFKNESMTYNSIRLIVEDIIENTMDTVELSKLTDDILLSLSKKSYSASSRSFWGSIFHFIYRIFDNYHMQSAMLSLCAIARQAWFTIRTNKNGDPFPKEMGIKLIALEGLHDFCLNAREKTRSSKIMGYLIRRIVVSCLLFNVKFAFIDPRIFSKILKIITPLWKKWRMHIRMEFAIICEQLVFKVLQATSVQIKPTYQLIVIQEVINWFDQPYMLLEMFVNYDMDRKFVSQWNTFSYLVRTLCAIGRRLTSNEASCENKIEASKTSSISFRDVYLQALDQVCKIAKILMDASGHAFLLMEDSAFRNRTLKVNYGWVEDDDALEETNPQKVSSETNDSKEKKRAGSIHLKIAAHEQSEKLIQNAIQIYSEKQSLKKAIKYLIKSGFMANSSQEVANFLRFYKHSFDPEAIGDFLGEGGIGQDEVEYWSQIRFRYTRAISFVEMDIEPALRLFLTECGFRLPGESQKIERIIEAFSKAFWQDNFGTPFCPFKSEDTVCIIAYSIIMLNTDLHKANVDPKKKSKKMTKEEFIKNLRGVDEGGTINKEYLSRIYDSVEMHRIELSVSNGKAKESTPTSSTREKTSLFGNSKNVNNELRIVEEKKFIKDLFVSIRDSEDLLRSLADTIYPFHITNVDTNISFNLVSFMFETVWFQFQTLAETLLSSEKSKDLFIQFLALDIISYSLSSALFLDLKVERMTFSNLLKKFKDTSLPSSPTENNDDWYSLVENVTPENVMTTIQRIHLLIVNLKDSLQEKNSREITKQVAQKFGKKNDILEKNSFFVREGNLNKINRAGRPFSYRFFLFSDYLIYAHFKSKNEYKVHAELHLSDMEIKEVEADHSDCSFFIEHPVKSFVVIAESSLEKHNWIRDLSQSIQNCKKRTEEKRAEAGIKRKMSIFERIENQKNIEIEDHKVAYQTTPERNLHRGSSNHPNSDKLVKNFGINSISPSENKQLSDKIKKTEDSFATVDISSAANNDLKNMVNIEKSQGYESDESETSSKISEIHEKFVEKELSDSISSKEKIENRIEGFKATLSQAADKEIETLFFGACTSWKGIKNSKGSMGKIQDDINENLGSLYLQSLYGDAPTNSYSQWTQGRAGVSQQNQQSEIPPQISTLSKDQDRWVASETQFHAWQGLKGFSSHEAKLEFLLLFLQAAPNWKFEQFL